MIPTCGKASPAKLSLAPLYKPPATTHCTTTTIAMRGPSKARGAPTDLLVCFPSRSHLALQPKAICSPSRRLPPHLRDRSTLFKTGPPSSNCREGLSSSEVAEPTSPKVTCAGKIKADPQRGPRRRRQPQHWLEALGIKKDVMHFLAALRGIRLGFACFRGNTDCTSDEEEEEEERRDGGDAFTRWFLLMEEKKRVGNLDVEDSGDGVPPPRNAMMLMRSRSAPGRRWEEEEERRHGVGGGDYVLERSRSCRRG